MYEASRQSVAEAGTAAALEASSGRPVLPCHAAPRARYCSPGGSRYAPATRTHGSFGAHVATLTFTKIHTTYDMQTRNYIYVHACIFMYTRVYLRTRAYIYVHGHIFTYTGIYLRTYTTLRRHTRAWQTRRHLYGKYIEIIRLLLLS